MNIRVYIANSVELENYACFMLEKISKYNFPNAAYIFEGISVFFYLL